MPLAKNWQAFTKRFYPHECVFSFAHAMALRILSTITNRLLTALLNFTIVVITARHLGTEGRGIISLLLLYITINQMFTGIVGGAALTFLVPRYGTGKSLVLSSIWAIGISVAVSPCLYLLQLLPYNLLAPLIILSAISALLINMQSVLLARQRIHAFNLGAVIQPLILLGAFLIYAKVNPVPSVEGYITASYISYGSSLLIALLMLKKNSNTVNTPIELRELLHKFLFHGGWGQLANLAQLLNYRFSYFCIETLINKGVSVLGVFSTAVSVSESAWMFSKSITTVQYAQAVNSTDRAALQQQALLLFKISVTGTLLLVGILLLLPDITYTWIFGPAFFELPHIIATISISIVALSGYTVLASYFSGTGRQNISSRASVIGLLITIPACLLLIPVYGLTGAAWAANLSHIGNGLYLFIEFRKESKIPLSNFVPVRSDLQKAKQALSKF